MIKYKSNILIYNKKFLVKYLMEFSLKQAFIMLGPAGAGKTSWIKENLNPDIRIISKDKIREDLGIIKNDGKKAIGTKEQENFIKRQQELQLIETLNSKLSFVLDNTNLGKDIQELILKIRKFGYYIVGVKINTPLEICILRRPEIPVRVLENMYKKLQTISPDMFDEFIEI